MKRIIQGTAIVITASLLLAGCKTWSGTSPDKTKILPIPAAPTKAAPKQAGARKIPFLKSLNAPKAATEPAIPAAPKTTKVAPPAAQTTPAAPAPVPQTAPVQN
jgi:hypothetical protein